MKTKNAMMSLVMGCALAGFGAPAWAAVLANWTFEASVPTTAGPHMAEAGVYAGTSGASGFHAGASTYSNPAGNGSAESFSSTNWMAGDYYQFSTSTVGYQSISITWDQTRSGTGPATFDLEYSIDGTTFFTLVNDYTVLENSAANGGAWNSTTYNPVYTFAPVAGPAVLDNQTTIWFRLTNQLTVAAGGTNRVDNVIIEGSLIPAPGTLALALLGLAGARGRRRRSA